MHAQQLGKYTHPHSFVDGSVRRHERRTHWVVALTAAMMVVEIAAGFITGSMALLADGFHMATHAGALAIAAAAYGFARRHAHDRRFTFGTGKVGDLAGFGSALLLAVFAAGIGAESVRRLFVPQDIAFGDAALVAVIGLVVNLVSAWLLSEGGHHHHDGHAHEHHHHHDNNLRSAYLHVLADALTSVLAIIALLAGRYFGVLWLDPVIGIVGALVIARWSWGLMRDTGRILVDSQAEDVATNIRELIENDGDAKVTDLHVWRVAPSAHACIISLVAGDPAGPPQYRTRLKALPTIVHSTIEIEACPGHA